MKVTLTIYVHDERKLFHVAVNKVGTTAHIGWENAASHARGMYERGIVGRACDGIVIALINTNYTGWKNVFLKNEFDKESLEYLNKKLEVIEYWEKNGYTNVGVRLHVSNGHGTSEIPAGWTRKFNVSNMPKKKIYEKINFINRSLQMDIPDKVKNLAYREVVSIRPTINFIIDDMISLLRFVRIKMGLETNLSLAA
jgi:hypothetical protein